MEMSSQLSVTIQHFNGFSTLKTLNPDSYRWSVRLSVYKFKVVHRSGKKQCHVDALSRAPLTTLLNIEEIKAAQNKAPTSPDFIQNEIVYRKTKGVRRVVVPPKLVVKLLQETHDGLGHPGINKCIRLISRQYYWKTLNSDVKDYVKSCHVCQMVKPSNHQPYGQLQPLESPDKPMKLIAIDTVVMGKIAKTTKSKYIQVVIDHHSRYVWAKATPTNTTTAAISALQSVFDAVPPSPEMKLLSDNGKNFDSKEFAKFLKQFNIKHVFTTPYHAQCNGMNEKANHTIVTRLRIAQQLYPKRKWSTLLPQVVKEYNQTIHSTTGFTPEFLLFGLGSEQTDLPLEDARKLATDRTIKFKQMKKRVYDRTHKPIQFQVKDLVKRRIPPNHPENNKMTPKYQGPFEIVKQLSDVNYIISLLDNPAYTMNIHVCNLEPYFTRSSALSDRGE